MIQNGIKFMIVVALTIFLGSGCAKKHKSDSENDLGNTLSRDSIQDKDMGFDPSGSDSGKIENLYTAHFDYDNSSLSEETRELLVKDANWLKRHSNQSFQIEGHCDRNGSIEYNLSLGQRRAEAVKHYLVNLGISQDRLATISYGKEKLLDSSETEVADAKNRRANFKPIDSPKLKRMSNL
jgi:peptidoglycan-associated lipoprotein